MEKLTLKTPSAVLSFIGHIFGFWPQESLVCITPNDNSIGANLSSYLPRQPGGQELPYAQTVAHYLTSDTAATSILSAAHTSETTQPGQAMPRPMGGPIGEIPGAGTVSLGQPVRCTRTLSRDGNDLQIRESKRPLLEPLETRRLSG